MAAATGRDRILLGRIAGAHGIRGEVIIHAFTEPAENIAAVGLYTSDVLSEGYRPVSMESPAALAATMEHVREILTEATVDLWKRIADWSRLQMLNGHRLAVGAALLVLALSTLTAVAMGRQVMAQRAILAVKEDW